MTGTPYEFALYTQGPSAADAEPLTKALAAARIADRYGYAGMLLFYSHQSLDPWMLASALIHGTDRLVPLIALQPYSMPPMTVAKMLRTVAHLHGRRIDINLIAGASPAELAEVGDTTPHDARYARATEYIQVIKALTASEEPFSLAGEHYRFDRLSINAALAPDLGPRIFVAGSSTAGREAAAAIADVAVTHPGPVTAFARDFAATVPAGVESGIRIGVLARPTAAEAWGEARARYPIDRESLIRTRLKQQAPSAWSRQLAGLAAEAETYDDVYWTGAFATGRSSYPLLVGDYDEVAAYLAGYLDAGVRAVLVAGVASEEDYAHAGQVFGRLRGTSDVDGEARRSVAAPAR